MIYVSYLSYDLALAGLMFWFTRKRFPGSYLFLISTSRL
jgi:hypothetical protein